VHAAERGSNAEALLDEVDPFVQVSATEEDMIE
jgi:hypothetical protein